MKTYTFNIVVEPDEDRWHAYCPALHAQGAATWGLTRAEALKNISDGTPRIVEVIGTTVTVDRYLTALSRVSTTTGLLLSGGVNGKIRISPGLFLRPCSHSLPRGRFARRGRMCLVALSIEFLQRPNLQLPQVLPKCVPNKRGTITLGEAGSAVRIL